ncbi:MAG: hypothetical protein ACHQ01_09970 [Candidatus Limnocylindrales bacterium]
MQTHPDRRIGLLALGIWGPAHWMASTPTGSGWRTARHLIVMALVAVAAAACATSAGSNGPSAALTEAQPSPSVTAPATAATESPAATASPRLIHVHLTGQGPNRDSGIAFEYPSDWHVVLPAFFLASYTNGDGRALFPTCCHLNPNQLAVSITTGTAVPVDMGALSSPGFDITSVGDWLVAKQTIPTQPSDFVDVHTYWLIGRPGTGQTVYGISAIFRGPDLAPMEAEVDAFVDSIRLDPEPAASPS